MTEKGRKTKVYTFDSTCNYVSDDPTFTKIPAGYINKTICGCGITSVALESKVDDCIIAVPNVALVENKVRQYNNTQYKDTFGKNTRAKGRFDGEVFGVIEGVDKDDINAYVERVKKPGTPIKIMVTYDSLHKCELLLDTSDCHLIIDESDKLVSYQVMKAKSKKNTEAFDPISKLYQIAERHKETVSFISATPIDVAFLPDFVGELEQIELRWTKTTKIIPITLKRQHPYNALQNEVILPIKTKGSVKLGDKIFSKVIVFINSVDTITKIIRECELDSEDVAILCGDNSRNALKIRGYKTLKADEPLPRYSFITSSGFQGIDLEDEEAMNVVVSCTGKSYQMIDLCTDLIQATSRQRNKHNPNYDRFVFIYDTNHFDKTEQQLLDEINEVKSRIKQNCETLENFWYHREPGLVGTVKYKKEYEATANTFLQSQDFVMFTSYNGSDFFFNKNVFEAMRYQIVNTRRMYTEGLTIVSDNLKVSPIVVDAPEEDRSTSFYSLKKKFDKLEKDGNDIYSDTIDNEFNELERAGDNFKLIKTYLKVYHKIPSNPTYAKRMVSHSGNQEKQFIIDLLDPFVEGGTYTSKQMKEHISKVYEAYKVTKTAKPTDICTFGVELHTKKSNTIQYIIDKMPNLDD